MGDTDRKHDENSSGRIANPAEFNNHEVLLLNIFLAFSEAGFVTLMEEIPKFAGFSSTYKGKPTNITSIVLSYQLASHLTSLL
jgi:hypothetical protein